MLNPPIRGDSVTVTYGLATTRTSTTPSDFFDAVTAGPMAPARSSNRRPHLDQNTIQRQNTLENINPDVQHSTLFIDPMQGTPLSLYIDKDVVDKPVLIDLITVSRVVLLKFRNAHTLFVVEEWRVGCCRL